MKKLFAFAILFCGLQVAIFAQKSPAPALSPNKQAVLKSVEVHEKHLIGLSDQVRDSERKGIEEIWPRVEQIVELKKKGTTVYKAQLPDGPPPVPEKLK